MVSVQAQKQVYKPGERVELRVKTTDFDGNPVSGEVAVWGVVREVSQNRNIPLSEGNNC